MVRRLGSLLLVAALACLAQPLTAGDDAKKLDEATLKALQGTWELTEVVADGEKSDLPAEKMKAILKGKTFKILIGDKVEHEGTFTLDTAKKPMHIDVKIEAGKEKGKTIPCVFEVKDGTYRSCYSLEEKDNPPRPTELASKAGSKTILITYKRIQP